MLPERRIDRTPVADLRPGDRVRAVEHGPIGTVVDPDRRGWTIVRYGYRVRFGSSETLVPYKHDVDHLILLET